MASPGMQHTHRINAVSTEGYTNLDLDFRAQELYR